MRSPASRQHRSDRARPAAPARRAAARLLRGRVAPRARPAGGGGSAGRRASPPGASGPKTRASPVAPCFATQPAAGLWYWKGTREEFEAQATEILLRLVHPLVARGLPFCLGFPFGAEVLEPRSLAVGESAALDLEDIGRLLRQRGCSRQLSARQASVTPCGGSRAAAPARERPGRGPARRRPARRRRARLRPGARARAGRLGQDQDAGEPRGRARGPRRGPFRHPHARLQPQGGRTARGAAGGAGHRQHAPPRLAAGRRRRGRAPSAAAPSRPAGGPPAPRPSAPPASTAPRSTPSATAISARCCGRASRSTTTAARFAPSWRAPWRRPASRCGSSSRAAAATRSARS